MSLGRLFKLFDDLLFFNVNTSFSALLALYSKAEKIAALVAQPVSDQRPSGGNVYIIMIIIIIIIIVMYIYIYICIYIYIGTTCLALLV